MTDYWQTKGLNDIQPNVDKGLRPYTGASNKDIGASDDRWGDTFVEDVSADGNLIVTGTAQINTDREDHGPVIIIFGDSSSSDAQVLIGASSTVHRVFLACAAMSSTSSDARVIMAQENDEAAIPVLSLKQRDESEAFIDLEGAYDSTAAKSITTGNGNGSVVGPKTKNTADYGFEYAGMFKVRTDIGSDLEDLWTPLYRKVTS